MLGQMNSIEKKLSCKSPYSINEISWMEKWKDCMNGLTLALEWSEDITYWQTFSWSVFGQPCWGSNLPFSLAISAPFAYILTQPHACGFLHKYLFMPLSYEIISALWSSLPSIPQTLTQTLSFVSISWAFWQNWLFFWPALPPRSVPTP